MRMRDSSTWTFERPPLATIAGYRFIAAAALHGVSEGLLLFKLD
jgi:hypothetical protein